MMPPPSILIPDTLKGVDDLIRADFEAFRAVWFARLLTATFFVVVGLVMEGPELWHEIHSIVHRWKFDRRFHFSIPEKHTPEWAKLLAFVGWVLIVAGVAGEFVADSFVSKADGYVQKFDEILLADTTRQAGNAKASAEVAAWAAHSAQGRADAVAATATKLAREQRATAKAQEETAKAQSELAKHLENVALRQRSRELDGKLLVKLLEGKPKARVDMRYNKDDSEAWWLANTIYLWLGKGNGRDPGAGWDVSPPRPVPEEWGYKGQNLDKAPTAMRFAGAGSSTGITFVTKELARNGKVEESLFALETTLVVSMTAGQRKGSPAGFGGEYDPSLPDDMIVLIVGPKAIWWPPLSWPQPGDAPR